MFGEGGTSRMYLLLELDKFLFISLTTDSIQDPLLIILAKQTDIKKDFQDYLLILLLYSL